MKKNVLIAAMLGLTLMAVSCKNNGSKKAAGNPEVAVDTTDYLAVYNDLMEDAEAKYMVIVSAESMTMEAKQEQLMDFMSELETSMVDLAGNAFQTHKSDSVAAAMIKMLYENELAQDAELLEKIEALDPEQKENDAIKAIVNRIDSTAATAEGCHFVDFEIPQPDGSVARLSDYAGNGKYCLVDFWASWCGPCRGEIPNLRAAYEKYADKGLNVLSVAVWDKVEDTQAAAKEHGVVWYQIVDAQKIPTDIYGIDGIPHIMLIGPDGTILKRGLRGKGIEEELQKYL